jgi:hypothetical protein
MFRTRLKPALGLALLCAMTAVLSSGACQKLTPDDEGLSAVIGKSSFSDGIPADYGRLVAAVPHFNGAWVSLWFERPDMSIVGVWVDTRNGEVGKTIELPRK